MNPWAAEDAARRVCLWGWPGTTSTLLSFGENGACVVEIVGKPREGLAWSWLKQAVVADAALRAACGGADEAFYRGKLQACQYFFRWELPRIGAQLTLLRSLDDTTRQMQPSWF